MPIFEIAAVDAVLFGVAAGAGAGVAGEYVFVKVFDEGGLIPFTIVDRAGGGAGAWTGAG